MNDQLQGDFAAEDKVVPAMNANSVGARLAYAREQKNWTIQYVAEQLKLSQTQIVALESDQFDRLPKLVIVRGFVRAYAKLLRLDGAELMQLMPQDQDTVALETSLRPALTTPFIEPRASLTGQPETNRRYVFGILILLILVVLTLFFQRTDYGQQVISIFSNSNHAQPTIELASAQVVSVSDSSQAVASEPIAANVVSGSQPVASVDSTNETHAAAGSIPVSSAVALADNSAKVPLGVESSGSSIASIEMANAGKNNLAPKTEKLTLKFKHDSWLFVKANGGAVLTSRMVRAGTEESFDVKQGLFVKIGNAVDVEASLRGEPLIVQTERDSKVATLTVK